MSENTENGPAGGNKEALPVTPHETYKPDRKGDGSFKPSGPAPSKGQAPKTGKPVNGG
jgi:hypothetical protein